MKTSNEFKEYYNNEYKKIVDLYAETHNNLLRKESEKTRIFLVIIFVFFTILSFAFNIYKSIVITILYFVIFSLLIFLLYVKQLLSVKKAICYDINKMLYMDIIRFISGNKDYSFNPDSRISKKYFQDSCMFNLEKYHYNGENYTNCSFNDQKIIFSDFYIYNYKYRTVEDYIVEKGITYKRTITRKIPNKLFSGCYIEVPFKENISSYIYLISNRFKNVVKGRIDKFLIYDGDRVYLENLSFENNYNVYSCEETMARYVLDLPYMENIVDIDNYVDCKKSIVYRPDHKISIFMEGFTIDSILKQNVDFEDDKISYSYLESFFNKINGIFIMINILQGKGK